MHPQEQTRTLDLLHKATQLQSTVLVWYRKPHETPEFSREIEPYALSEGKHDILLRGYQLKPEPGWKFFVLHHVIELSITGNLFKPRRKINIGLSRVLKLKSQLKPSMLCPITGNGLSGYRESVLATVSDMQINSDEAQRLKKLRQEHHITSEQMLSAHYSVFHDLMSAVLEDSEVSPDEIRQLKDLNESLRKCGAGVLD